MDEIDDQEDIASDEEVNNYDAEPIVTPMTSTWPHLTWMTRTVTAMKSIEIRILVETNGRKPREKRKKSHDQCPYSSTWVKGHRFQY